MSENIKKRYKGYMHYQRYNSTLAPSLLVAITRGYSEENYFISEDFVTLIQI